MTHSNQRTPTGTFVGLTTLDVVQVIDRVPVSNQKITSAEQFMSAGGPAANAAITFSALGGRARLITALGSGMAAQIAKQDLEAHGVDVVDFACDSDTLLPVSTALITAHSGDRAVISTDGTSIRATPPPDIHRYIEKSGIILIDGHHFELAADAAKAAAEMMKTVVLDAGRWKPGVEELLPFVDVAICSNDFRTRDGEHGGNPLIEYGIKQVAVTNGPHDIQWWDEHGNASVRVPEIKPVDTLGAGDVFHGAYAYFHMKSSRDFVGNLERAARVAALSCTYLGARAWIQDLPQII